MKYVTKILGLIVLLIFVVFLIHIGLVEYDNYKSQHYLDYEVEGENGKTYSSYQDACEDCDFVAAHKFLNNLCEKLQGAIENRKYVEGCKYVFQKESNYLISKGDEQSAKRLTFLLSEFEHNIYSDKQRSIPSEGISTERKDYYYVNNHNLCCMELLESSITVGNQYSAKLFLQQILPDLNYIEAKEDKAHEYAISYNGKKMKVGYSDCYIFKSDETKTKAEQLYKEALEKGILSE